MILAISGSRYATPQYDTEASIEVGRNFVARIVDDFYRRTRWNVEKMVFGDAKGVDWGAKWWCRQNDFPYEEFEADWNRHGKSAGILRNKEIANVADGLLAIRFDESSGTTHMIKEMNDRGKPVVVVNFYSKVKFLSGSSQGLD